MYLLFRSRPSPLSNLVVLGILHIFSPLVFPYGEISRFDEIGEKQGLSHSNVLAIARDQRGFMWFGTEDGLNRYDGYSCKVFRYNPENPRSLSANYVMALHVDVNGVLWVGTFGGGLCRYSWETEDFTAFKHDPANPNSLNHNDVDCILETGDNRIWVGNWGSGVAYFNSTLEAPDFINGDHPLAAKGLEDKVVTVLREDGVGGIWAGTESNGLYHARAWGDDAPRFRPVPHLQVGPMGLSSKQIRSLEQDETHLWIGTQDKGVFRINLENVWAQRWMFQHFAADPKTPGSLPDNSINTILKTYEGHLLMGLHGDGLTRFHGDTGLFTTRVHNRADPRSLSHNKVYTLFQTPANPNLLWIGTYGGGVNVLDTNPRFKKWRAHSDGGFDAATCFAMEPDGSVLVGSQGGLSRIRADLSDWAPDSKEPTIPRFLKNREIAALLVGRKGEIWAANKRGLHRLEKDKPPRLYEYAKNHEPGLIPYTICAMMEDPQASPQTLWLATDGGGLQRFRPQMELDRGLRVFKADPAQENSLPFDWICSVFRDRRGRFWTGTWGRGLALMIPDENGDDRNHFRNFRQGVGEQNLPGDTIWCFWEDDKNGLWLGTDKGLGYLSSNQDPFKEQITFSSLRKGDGLPTETIYGLAPDGLGNLWISTPAGLSRLNLETRHFRNYNNHDGLLNNEMKPYVYAKTTKNTLLFGGQDGFNMFQPETFQKPLSPPHITVTNLLLFNQEVKPNPDGEEHILHQAMPATHELTLSTNDIFTFTFSALDHHMPERIQYAYQMKGVNSHWVTTDAQLRRATYTGLRPGHYQFKVKAANADGIWSAAQHQVHITIPKPPWRSWWALLVYGLIFSYGIFLVVANIRGKLRSQRRALEHARQMEALKDQFNQELEEKIVANRKELLGVRKKLLEAARTAGMAENASEVLHNVGNALNSVVTSIHFIREKSDEKKYLKLLERIHRLMTDKEEELKACFGPETKSLLTALDMARCRLDAQRNHISDEAQLLEERTKSIEITLKDQRSNVNLKSRIMERVGLFEVLESMVEEHEAARSGILIMEPPPSGLKPVILDRFKFHRVFDHVINNALEALQERDGKQPQIHVELADDGPYTALKIRDNGTGLSQDRMDRVFSQGYTEKSGHKGFGLHYCANAMKEMEGGIQIIPNPSGKGVTVTLLFPKSPVREG